MGKVNVVIVDATGNKEQKVGLPDDIKCGIIMVKLVEKIKLPSVGPDGNPISYKFIHKVTGRQLLEAQTLGEAGIKDGDVLRLQPEITAGAVCANCGNTENDEQRFCSKCGTALTNAQTSEAVNNIPNQSYVVDKPNKNPASNIDFNLIFKTVKQKIKGKFSCVLGMVSGLISVIFGIVTLSQDTGSWESSSTYGGDAYTGIQNATAQTANNIQDLAEIVALGVGFVLIALGLFAIFYFLTKFNDSSDLK